MTEQTPTKPPQQPDAAAAEEPQQPGAPLKRQHAMRAAAWAQFTGSMGTMPVSQARRLSPKDIGVHFGPVMDEAQFEAYRKAQGGNVRVLK